MTVVDRPPTDRQQQILAYLRDHPQSTPAEIAYGIGITRGPRRRGNGAAGRGGWAGYMSPAQYVIGSLTSLERRGLISYRRRHDGRSGTAYSLAEDYRYR